MNNAFAGSDYSPTFDDTRLTTQIDRIREAMIDGSWRTLREIAAITGDGEASVSAQIRNLRKAAHGSYVIEKRPRGDRMHGLFEYRLLPPIHRDTLF